MRNLAFSVAAVCLLVASALLTPVPVGSAIPTARVALLAEGSGQLQHIVFVVMENHAFDNYFGTYCQVVGAFCPDTANGIPAGVCMPKDPYNVTGQTGCVRPFNLTGETSKNPPHLWSNSNLAWDGGKMDGFYYAEKNWTLPMGHYNGSTIPVYWDMAQEFGLGDNFYSATRTYSLPNHWYIVAGQSPAAARV